MKRPMLKVSKNGNPYFITTSGNRVMVPEDVAEIWDDILEVETADVHYDQSTDAQGNLVDTPFTRTEIIDYTTMTRELKLTQHKVAVNTLVDKARLDLEKLAALA